jgi:hypothetical protein
LPALQDQLENCLILNIVIKSKTDTMLQVFYKSSRSDNYSEERSVQKQVKVGDNIIFIPFSNKSISQLRIDPANEPGEFIIKHLEIRSVKLDK